MDLTDREIGQLRKQLTSVTAVKHNILICVLSTVGML